MAAITVQEIVLAGVTPTFVAAAAGGDSFVNDGKTFYYVKNGGGGALVVTFASETNCNQGFDHDAVENIAAGIDSVVGPFPKSRFNDSGGLVQVTYDGVVSVTVSALKINL